jgi:hypothetical protein
MGGWCLVQAPALDNPSAPSPQQLTLAAAALTGLAGTRVSFHAPLWSKMPPPDALLRTFVGVVRTSGAVQQHPQQQYTGATA